MQLNAILEAIAGAAGQLTGVFPPAAVVAIGAGLVGTILTTLHQNNIQVVDEEGNPVPAEVLVTRINEKFAHAIANAKEGSRVAQDELDKLE